MKPKDTNEYANGRMRARLEPSATAQAMIPMIEAIAIRAGSTINIRDAMRSRLPLREPSEAHT